MTITISMIAAVAENGVIGSANAMPWHLPGDFAFFKRTTLGKPLIMGRKTFESIGRPLPGRTNIVVTARKDFHPDGVVVAANPDEALDQALVLAEAQNVDEVMIGGGGVLYDALMDRSDRLYITHVALTPDGDTRFPAIDPDIWRVVSEPEVPPSEKDTASFRVTIYERSRPRAH